MADAPDGGSADARVDAEPSALARASMPVYVGGYLALYGMGDEGELVLTREQVARALPPAAPLPINIDHASACEVGAVLALADDDAGLFFVGVINCPQLADTLAGVAHPAFFGADAPRSRRASASCTSSATTCPPCRSLRAASRPTKRPTARSLPTSRCAC